jgi:hypothetical protein
MRCAQNEAAKGTQLNTTQNGSTHKWGFQCLGEITIVPGPVFICSVSCSQYVCSVAEKYPLPPRPFAAHLLHTPTPNKLFFLYAPDNSLTATHLSYWLPFSQIKLLITHGSFSHSPLFPKETPGFLELRSQKYSAKKIRLHIFIFFFFLFFVELLFFCSCYNLFC